jgi:hypothetical protein
MVIHFCRLN